MTKTIRFSVHENPLKDNEGNTTYQVRHENWQTLDTKALVDHLKNHNNMLTKMVEPVLDLMSEEIVENITDNYRLHLNGIGTFFLKIGFRERTDDEGNEKRPQFTDPAQITGDAVEVQGIGFTPDHELLNRLASVGYYFQNVQKKGSVGKSNRYELDDIKQQLDAYLNEHGYITRTEFARMFGLTTYMAKAYLKNLLEDPDCHIIDTKESRIHIYKRG